MNVNIIRSWVRLFEKYQIIRNLQSRICLLRDQDSLSCPDRCWLKPWPYLLYNYSKQKEILYGDHAYNAVIESRWDEPLILV
jgi:hypothetical protein